MSPVYCSRDWHEKTLKRDLKTFMRGTVDWKPFDDGMEFGVMGRCHCGSSLVFALGESRALPAPEGGIKDVLERFR